MLPIAIDWENFFAPPVYLWLYGQDPYQAIFFNPPWLLPILLPFAILPGDIARILLLIVSVAAMTYAGYRLGGKPLSVAAFVVSPFVFDSLAWGNVEWLVVLGMALGGPVGLLLAALKPQMSVAVILFWLIETWQTKGRQAFVRLVWFPALIVAVSFVVFGFWPRNMLTYQATLSISLFPYGIPIGLMLFVLALRTHRLHYALAASPFFFPTVTPQCWLVTFLALIPDAKSLTLSTAAYWTFILIQP